MIEDAEEKGLLKKMEPSLSYSGEYRIGLAMVAAVNTLILVMPESMSIERRRLMSLYGAEFV
jgi:cysteine synthase A